MASYMGCLGVLLVSGSFWQSAVYPGYVLLISSHPGNVFGTSRNEAYLPLTFRSSSAARYCCSTITKSNARRATCFFLLTEKAHVIVFWSSSSVLHPIHHLCMNSNIMKKNDPLAQEPAKMCSFSVVCLPRKLDYVNSVQETSLLWPTAAFRVWFPCPSACKLRCVHLLAQSDVPNRGGGFLNAVRNVKTCRTVVI